MAAKSTKSKKSTKHKKNSTRYVDAVKDFITPQLEIRFLSRTSKPKSKKNKKAAKLTPTIKSQSAPQTDQRVRHTKTIDQASEPTSYSYFQQYWTRPVQIVAMVALVILIGLLAFLIQRSINSNPFIEEQTEITQEEPVPSTDTNDQAGTLTTIPPIATPAAPASVPEVHTPPATPSASTIPQVSATPTPTGSITPQAAQTQASTYTIKAGDTLWSIAQSVYGDGYAWVDIAKANNLTEISIIHSDNVLIIPQRDTKGAQVGPNQTQQPQQQAVQNNQQVKSYTVQSGDTLWSIAQKVYNDGYQWTKIAQANNLSNNPNLIHAGNTLTIP